VQHTPKHTIHTSLPGIRACKSWLALVIGTVLGVFAPALTQAQSPPKIVLLHAFSGVNDGGEPAAGLLQGSDGNLYGTAAEGGAQNLGTVFKISLTGKLTLLHSFSGTDGAVPLAGLIQSTDGYLYGTTNAQGTYNYGTVFRISPNGSNFQTLHAFTDSSGSVSPLDGADPDAGLIQGQDGNFYGTTLAGGTYGWGTLFRITPAGQESVLYSFEGPYPGGYSLPWDGAYPHSLIQASDGNFYGTTQYGGNEYSNTYSYGTVFSVSPSGQEIMLYRFSAPNPGSSINADGANPLGGLVEDRLNPGTFYGTTQSGGQTGFGTVFKITSAGSLTPLHSFLESGISTSDGYSPLAGLTQASDGNLYGTTSQGGGSAYGTVFQITPAGVERVLYTFSLLNSNQADTYGADPQAGLIQASDGNFYGTTFRGGANSLGTIFKLELAILKLSPTKLSRDSSGNIVAQLTIKDTGYLTASGVTITKSTLNAIATSMAQPISLGDIASGSTAQSTLTFPGSAGTSGQTVTLSISGTMFRTGKFTLSQKVTLP